MNRLFDALHAHAPRLVEDAITTLVALGAFTAFGGVLRACTAIVGG